MRTPDRSSASRRNWLRRSTQTLGLAVLGVSFGLGAANSAHAADQFTDWGWPLPYEKVSDKSVQWLKDKGWWPIHVAFQPTWGGGATINIVMDRLELLKKRGVDTKFQGFVGGPAVNEVIVSSRFQVANGGNLPFALLLDKRVPVKSIAIVTPNIAHALVVPNDSPIKSFKDLKGSNPPATIGLVTGSSGEFYVQAAAQANGIEIGKDVILKNMPPAEQMLLPRGLTAVATWDPIISMMTHERKNGRVVDTIYPYNMYEGTFYVRDELIQNVPDVVQAFSDAFAEAVLWTRRNPQKAVDLTAEDPSVKLFPKAVLLQQIELYNNYYKPTYIFPHGEFWGQANASLFKWMQEQNRISRPMTAQDFAASIDDRFMKRTFERLGWAVPAQPPFIPKGWTGSPAKTPYPPYLTPLDGKPQVFPETGDLVKPWGFAGQMHAPK